MMFSRDKEFEEALASPEALEKRLATLRKTRKIAYIAAVSLVVLFFILVLMGLSILMRFPNGNATGTAINASMTLLLAFLQALAAVCAHTEIRSLMVYKKMREATAPEGNPS